MKTPLKVFFLYFFFISLLFAQEEGEYAKDIKERTLRLPACIQPIGTITTKSFTCKAAACKGGKIYFGSGYTIEATTQMLGDGLADMLITALANTGCFKVVERIALQEIKEELELMGVKPTQTLKAADFIVTGAVTALETEASGIGGGGIVIPLPLKFGGGIKLKKSSAHIALDMRIVRVKDAEILAAKTVEGRSERWRFGLAVGGLLGTTGTGAWMEAVKNTPLEEATRDLIAKAVTLIVEQTKTYAAPGTIGEKIMVFDEKGNVIKEEVKLPSVSKVTETKSKSEVYESQEIKRATIGFDHYENILWSEDFSTCKFIPTTLKVTKGNGECVEFMEKKWFATTKGELMFEKPIKSFAPSKDWSLEFKIYYGKGEGYDPYNFVQIFLGKEGSPIDVKLSRDLSDFKFSAQTIPNEAGLPKSLKGQMIKAGIKKEGEIVHLFINDVRVLSVPVDSVALQTLPAKILVKMAGEDIAKGTYTLITDLKLSQK